MFSMNTASQCILRPPCPKRDSRREPVPSWIDDLAICADSGVGFAINQHYRSVSHGLRHQSHEFEDKSVYLRFSPQMCFYGLFDGNDGDQAAAFAAQRLPAEVLFEAAKVGHESDLNERDFIAEMLKKSFVALERSFFESDTSRMSDIIAERSQLLLIIQDSYQSSIDRARLELPDMVNRLEELDQLIMCGTTAAVALIYCGYIYVANCGDSRTLLVSNPNNNLDPDCQIVHQLSRDHNLTNPDEFRRIRNLGVDISSVRRNGGLIVNQRTTRCIGNYFVKAGHKEFDAFKHLESPPVSFEPEVKVQELDESSQFIVMMSYGVLNAYKEVLLATSQLGERGFDERVNKGIVDMILEELDRQSTLCGVTQTVVDRICRLHHDMYLKSQSEVNSSDFDHVEDMTLLIRNIHYPFKGSITSSDNKLDMARNEGQVLSKQEPTARDRELAFGHIDEIVKVGLPYNISDERTLTQGKSISTTSDGSSSDVTRGASGKALDKDSEGKIAAYVDFSSYYANKEKSEREKKSAQ